MMNIIERIENMLEMDVDKVNIRDAIEELAYAVEELKKRQWIPVDEKLPEKRGFYLVIVNDGLNNPVCEIISYGNSLCNIFDYEKVIHWMPLPELPHD